MQNARKTNCLTTPARPPFWGLAVLVSVVLLTNGIPVAANPDTLQRRGSPHGSLDCFREWSEALQWVKDERLADVGRVLRRVGDAAKGRVMSTSLCKPAAEGGQPAFVYLVVVRSDNGRLKQMVLDAKTLDRL